MKNKKYVYTAIFSLVLGAMALGSDASANELRVGVEASTTLKVRSVEMQRKVGATTTLRANIEVRKLELEAKWAEKDAARETMRAQVEAKRASSSERRVEWKKDMAKKKVENTVRMMNATIERLEKMITRIEARIAKLKAAGAATVEAEGFVAAAKGNLVDAKASIAAFATIDLSSSKAQENFERIRTTAAKAREDIRKAHMNMMMAVRSLMALDVSVTATSTVRVNN